MNLQSTLPGLTRHERSRSEITMAEFVDQCKAKGELSVPADDPIYLYAERAGIPDQFLELAWLEFRERHLDNPAKKYRDWRAAFRNSVRDNWFRLWRYADSQCVLTVQGEQATRVHGKAVPARPNRQESLEARNRAVAERLVASQRPSRHGGFDQIDYREGVNEDGSF